MTTPALFRHACTIYDLMKAQAFEEDGCLVWEGHTTRLFTEAKLSTPRYTHVMNCLKSMKCLEQVQRGGGSGTSKWLLIQDPTADLYDRAGTGARKRATMANEMNQQRERDVIHRVRELERDVAFLKEHVVEKEKQP